MQTKKVVIIGAGPAGLACAAELAKNKDYEVTVLEKNPEPSYKVCGGGIDVKYFKREFSPDLVEREFSQFFIITPRNTFPVGDGSVVFAGTLNRKTLNQHLSRRAEEAGARMLYAKTAAAIDDQKVTAQTGEEFPYDFLVGADGANSMVRRLLGLKTERFLVAYQYMVPGDYPKMEFYIDFQKFGITYNWIFPQRGVISVGTGYAAAEGKSHEQVAGLKTAFDAWCKERFSLEAARFEGHTINYDYRGFEFKNIFLAGDAGGFASGLTGEGIKPAILSGQDIARRIQDPGFDCVGIKECLHIKRREDGLLHLMIDKPFGPLFTAFVKRFIDRPWFKRLMLKLM